MHDALLQPKETVVVMGLGDQEVTSCKCLSVTCVFEYKCAHLWFPSWSLVFRKVHRKVWASFCWEIPFASWMTMVLVGLHRVSVFFFWPVCFEYECAKPSRHLVASATSLGLATSLSRVQSFETHDIFVASAILQASCRIIWLWVLHLRASRHCRRESDKPRDLLLRAQNFSFRRNNQHEAEPLRRRAEQ